MPATLTFAGVPTTIGQVRRTIGLLSYYRQFLRSGRPSCCSPLGGWTAQQLDRDGARRELAMLIHCAIQRKAGIPDVACRKQEPEYQIRLARDCRGVRDAVNRRARARGLNGRRWETDEIQARFGHLIDPEDF